MAEHEQSIWKKPAVIIGIAGGFFVILIAIMVIAVRSSDPMLEYEGMFVKYAQDCVISTEEKSALDTFSANNKLEAAKVKEMESRFMADKCASKEPAKPQAQTPASPPTASAESKKPIDTAAQGEIEAKLNLQQGLNYVRAKDFDNAINEFTLAIQKNPQLAVALSNRGIAYMQQKKFNKALDDLQKAREIAPRDPVIRYNLAALYSVQNQLDRAMDVLDSALTLGFADYDSLRKDPDLANARAHPDFRKILEKHKVFLR